MKEEMSLGIGCAPVKMFIHLGVHMSVRDQKILPAVVVVIEESIAKTYKRNSCRSDSAPIADVGESACAIVSKYHVKVVRKCRIHHVQMAVILIVASGDAHIRDLAAISV